ncbi:MAG: PP2C family protein-serine/threonine phosphatase [Terracidiphilus sp.]
MLPRRLPVSAGLLFLALVLATVHLPAQSVVSISPQQCVWRAGDNPAWAAPNLDESTWQPLATWKLPDEPHYWIRCHADLSSLRTLAHPALSVRHNMAYQLYFDNALVGTNGDLKSGNSYPDDYQSFLIDGAKVTTAGESTIAIRAFLRVLVPFMPDPTVHILAGDAQLLREHRDSLVVADEANWLATAIGFGVIGVAGFIFLGLYCFERSRHELLMLALVCWGLSCLRILQTLSASHIATWSSERSVLWMVASACTNMMPLLAYWLNGRRVAFFYKIVLSLQLSYIGITLLLMPLLSLDSGYAWDHFYLLHIYFFATTAPIFSSSLIAAFLPWRAVAPQTRPLALCCFLWGAADLLYLLPQFAALSSPRAMVLYVHLQPRLLEVRGIGVISVVIALVVLTFRDQQRTSRERVRLAGEMHAARAVQQVIIPEAIPSVPGFNLEGVYKPAGEAGGDFFQIIPTPRGGVLAVIGDVSGKGMPAAMTVSLLVGTFRTLAHYTQSPGEILRAMNQRMLARSHGGFTTCLVLRADPDGKLIVANAGHLAPYVNGEEMKIENGLPLGLAADSNYTESTLTLAPGGMLTLMTDGVVEARNAQGELFGFDHTQALSGQPAEAIAQAAQSFGQEDDITVLTLAFAPAEVARA